MPKTLLQTILAAFCAILAHTSCMGGGGMRNLAMRAAMLGKTEGGWVNPYVTNGLVGMWDGIKSQKAANSWTDIINSLPATGTGATPSTNSMYIAGTTKNHLLGSTPFSSSQTAFSVEICLKAETSPSTYWVVFSFINSTTSAAKRIQINIENNMRFHIVNSGVLTVNTDVTQISGKRGTLTFTWNGSSMSCFFNAASKGTMTSTQAKISECLGSGKFVIGNVDAGISNNDYKGDVYAVRFYNRVLSASEIVSNYNQDVSRFGL